jgi:CheY-like chemotaxis protein
MQTTVRVLLVDDEETSYVLLRRMLEQGAGQDLCYGLGTAATGRGWRP